MNESVLLLHGIYTKRWVMRPFARLLREQGFTADTFGYDSVWQRFPQHVAALAERVAAHEGVLHLVGHSLGGLVLRHFAAEHPNLVRGRIVTLGTPHQGSATAETIRRLGLARPLLGGAYRRALDGRVPALPAGIELGSLAGNRNLGVGQLLRLDGEGDGTVRVAETVCPGMADHLVLPVSHSSMLWDAEAARQTACFLRHGRFDHGGAAEAV